ncbi:UTRA domain-containing protein [Rhizobium binxianense]
MFLDETLDIVGGGERRGLKLLGLELLAADQVQGGLEGEAPMPCVCCVIVAFSVPALTASRPARSPSKPTMIASARPTTSRFPWPKPIFPPAGSQFRSEIRETYSMTKALAHYGVVDYKRDVTRCTARMPSPSDVKYLRQSELMPVLFVESVDVDLEGQPIVYHETRYAGERVQFVIRRGDL